MVFQKGKTGYNKGRKFSEETKQKMRLAKLGKPLSEEHRKHLSESKKGRLITPMTPEIIEKIRLAKTGIPNLKTSIGLKKAYAEGKYTPSMKGRTWESIYGKEKADIMKKNMGKQNIGRIGWNNGLTKFDHPSIMKGSKNCIFKDPNFGEKYKDAIQTGLQRKPSSYERKICDLCIEENLPFIYTGDGKFYIGNKNPDFIDKERKIIIEVYDSYFKIKKNGSVEEYQRLRKEFYKERGWDVIFIDEHDIKSSDWKSKCLNKIGGLN